MPGSTSPVKRSDAVRERDGGGRQHYANLYVERSCLWGVEIWIVLKYPSTSQFRVLFWVRGRAWMLSQAAEGWGTMSSLAMPVSQLASLHVIGLREEAV